MRRLIPICQILLFGSLTLGCAASGPRLKPEVAHSLVNLTLEPAEIVKIKPVVLKPAFEVATHLIQVGPASYYHSFFDGRTTANGETFSNELMTAASRTLDFGTRVKVTNLRNSKSVIVRINDRGPYVTGRIIDLSRRAADALGFVHSGIAKVRVEPLM